MKRLFTALRPVLLPLGLIVAVSALLLAMDPAKDTSKVARIPRVALMQHASQGALDDGVAGVLLGLEKRGFIAGKTMQLQKFNAQGEMATANDIARRVTDGSFDLVITVSTASLQAVANVNRQHHVPHVFGIVAKSSIAGVGVSATDPLDHPPYMSGADSFLPVDKPIGMARRMYPGLHKLGLVWHSAEANSEAYTKAAREVCSKLGIELLEATVDSPSGVGEAAASLASRGAEAFMVTGDVMVLVSVDSVIKAGLQAGIPTFTLSPGNVRKGGLFDLGADFMTVGMETGDLAADVLGGRNLKDVPVTNRVPERFNLNLVALAKFPKWRLPPGAAEEAQVLIDASGERNDNATRGH
jgi:putative ABC transport system substrate-binding protein